MTDHASARVVVALVAGAIFGFGLALSGLAFVLGGAVLVAVPGLMLQRRFSRPLLDQRFYLPEASHIDWRLLVGSTIFGVGWGMAGFCPGPVVSILGMGKPLALLFVVTMGLGMIVHDRIAARRLR